PDTGVVFVRTDLRPRAQVPARVELVTGTNRRTTLGYPPADVSLVEHVLAALAGLRVDNCFVELNAPEPPGLDGSAQGLVDALHPAGAARRPAGGAVGWGGSAVAATPGAAPLSLPPAVSGRLKVSSLLDYGLPSPIDRQQVTQIITPESFANDIAPCRTFLLE